MRELMTTRMRAAWAARGGLTAEERARSAAASRARWQDPAFARRVSEAVRRGWREQGGYSAERRAAYREMALTRWRDPAYRARALAAMQHRRRPKDGGRRGKVAPYPPARPV